MVLLGALSVVIAAAGGVAYLSARPSAPEAPRGPRADGEPAVIDAEASPRPKVVGGTREIKQSPWKFEISPVGGGPHVSDKQSQRLRAQKPRLRKLVRATYDGLFLEPEQRAKGVKDLFSARSASALLASSAGLKPTVQDVRAVRRSASIGILAGRANNAAAKITIGAKGANRNGEFHVLHRSTLWLERALGKWTVIAFDVDQRR